jgi:hypothetical protein
VTKTFIPRWHIANIAIPLDPPWIWEIEDKHPSWTNTTREIHHQFHAKNTNACTFPRNTIIANSMFLILFHYLWLAIWEIEDKHPSWTNTTREIHYQFHAKNTNECTFPRNTVIANSMILILFQLWIPNWEMLFQSVHDAYHILSTAFYRTQLGEARAYKWGIFSQGMVHRESGGWSWIRSTRQCRPLPVGRLRLSVTSLPAPATAIPLKLQPSLCIPAAKEHAHLQKATTNDCIFYLR